MASGDRTYIADKTTLDEMNVKIDSILSSGNELVLNPTRTEQIILADTSTTFVNNVNSFPFTVPKKGKIRIRFSGYSSDSYYYYVGVILKSKLSSITNNTTL